MRFDVDGVDLAPYIAKGGAKFERFACSTKDSGRDTQTAEMHLTVLAKKHKITLTMKPMTAEESAEVYAALEPTWMNVTFTSPYTGSEYSCQMYGGDEPATHLMERNGQDFFEGMEIQLIEK